MPTVNKIKNIKEYDPKLEMIAQGNDLIRHARFHLSSMELNIIYYAMSKIKPQDKDFMHIKFTVSEFCEMCGIDMLDGHVGGREYRRVKTAVKSISDKSAWTIYPDGSEELVRWFDTAKARPKEGEISIIFSQSIKPYLIGLIERAKSGGEGYTQTMLLTHLALQSKHSKRLYEILKSYLYSSGKLERIYKETILDYQLDEFKTLLNVENYKRFPDLRRYVLEVARDEINNYSDIDMSYEPTFTGRRVTGIRFTCVHKKTIDRMSSFNAAKKVLVRGDDI